MLKKVENLILGAGLSGLSAAYHFRKAGNDDLLILEKTNRAGGLCKSMKYEGDFTYDQSIHVLYSSNRYASDLIKALLEDNLIVHDREAWVYSNGIYTEYPWQANTHGLPPEVVKECLVGVIKATYEKNGKGKPSNFEDWCFATFGDGFAKHFMIPYNRKLWAIDLKRMTDAWIKDRVMTPSLHEVIEGALQKPTRGFGPNSVFWYPKKGGIEALPMGFCAHLGDEDIAFRAKVAKISLTKKSVMSADGREWGYDRLISSLPLPVLFGCIEPQVPSEMERSCGGLQYNTVYAINLAVHRDDISPYHWVYFPEEKFVFYRVSYPKNFSGSMVPNGWSSLTVEVSTSKYKPVPSGNELVARVVADLQHAGILKTDDDIDVKSILILKPAYVIYNHSHRSDVDRLHAFLKENDIYPCGRFGEWEYLNMDHAILSGKKVVEETLSRNSGCIPRSDSTELVEESLRGQ